MILHLLVVLEIDQSNGGTKDHLARWLYLTHVDYLTARQFAFDFRNAALTKALLFTRRVILGVLFKIAVLASFGNGFDYSGTSNALQLVELGAQILCTLDSHWNALHSLHLNS